MGRSEWPFVPKPFKDELLSSWITRIADMHYTNVQGLFSKKYTKERPYTKDMDIYNYSDNFWNKLSMSTGYGVDKIKQLRLTTFDGIIKEGIDSFGKQQWIITISKGVKYQRRIEKAMRFCPICLREHGYYKKEWRLLFINACTKHKCFLENECPSCGSAVVPTLSSEHIGATVCHSCGFDLKNTTPTYVYGNSQGLGAISRIKKIMKDGYVFIDGIPRHSIGYFLAVRLMVRLLDRASRDDSIFKMESTWRNVIKSTPMQPYMEHMSIKKLYCLVSLADNMIRRWPLVFANFCLRNDFTNYHAILDKYKRKELIGSVPFWFVEGLDTFIRKIHPISETELQNIKEYLLREGKLNAKEFSKLTGYELTNTYRLLS